MMLLDREQRRSSTCCQHCGAHVTESFRRTFGDEDGVAHRCLACDSRIRLHAGSGAGRSVSHPDPEDHPNRDRGRSRPVSTDGGASP